MKKIIWLSRDPVTGQIKEYPKPFNKIIEKGYLDKVDSVKIDYFDATILFNYETNIHTQQIPQRKIGKIIKKAGNRTVIRVNVEDSATFIETPGYFNGVYLFGNNFNSNILRFDINNDMYVDEDNNSTDNELIPVWKCSKKIGRSSYVTDEWNIYSPEINQLIESKKNENISEFVIDMGAKKYKINFQEGIYALQTCVSFNKERVMRRELMLKNEYIKYIDKLKQENNSEETCPICLDKFSESFTFTSFLTNCNHRIHDICAQVIADNPDLDARRCPICRSDVNWIQCSPNITINSGIFGNRNTFGRFG